MGSVSSSRGDMGAAVASAASLKYSRTWSLHSLQANTVERQINAKQRALQRIRWYISGVMIGAAVVLGVWYELMHFKLFSEYETSTCLRDARAHLHYFLTSMLLYVRFLLLCLAPLADDIYLTQLVLVINVIVVAIGYIQILTIFTLNSMRSLHLVSFVLHTCNTVYMTVASLHGVLQLDDALSMQAYMWKVLSIYLIASVPATTALTLESTCYCRGLTAEVEMIPVQIAVLFVTLRADLREGVQAWLRLVFDKYGALRAAAGIAGLVGTCASSQILMESIERFRTVRLMDVQYEDVLNNLPQPELFSRTAHCRLSDCDAFVSHSWHDDPVAKWAALQEWRSSFVTVHGREPKIWFDKFCIDQNDIEANLRCLPVFLSGCERLVVFSGVTYLSRLWCIMELFTFVHMGRSVDQIEFVYVVSAVHEGSDRAMIDDGFNNFDAANCRCFQVQEKEKLLGIIHAAFGSLGSFNQAVQKIFLEAGCCGESRREGSSEEESISMLDPGSSSS